MQVPGVSTAVAACATPVNMTSVWPTHETEHHYRPPHTLDGLAVVLPCCLLAAHALWQYVSASG